MAIHQTPCTVSELKREIERTRLRRHVKRLEERLAFLRSGQTDLHREMIQELRRELEALRLETTGR
ncbi:MAG: hypothetical protein ACREX9_23170 [Gammaproteobacteria bacterium]